MAKSLGVSGLTPGAASQTEMHPGTEHSVLAEGAGPIPGFSRVLKTDAPSPHS